MTGAERPRVTERSRTLLHKQFANGLKPESQIEAAAKAAEISRPVLIAAAERLGVRTQRRQWWLLSAKLAPELAPDSWGGEVFRRVWRGDGWR